MMAWTTTVIWLLVVIVYAHLVDSQKIMQAIDDVHQVAGSDADLSCVVYSLKDSSVVWQRYLSRGGVEVISVHGAIATRNPRLPDGREKYAIDMTKHTKRQYIFRLTVRQLVAEDSGIYQCQIMRKGQASQQWPMVNGTLLVQYSPMIRTGYTSSWMDVAENGSSTLTCQADGVPEPRISWVRANGLPFRDGRLVIQGRELHIDKAGEEDRGVYRCRAENDVRPSAIVDIMMDVHFKPRIVPFRHHVGQSTGMNLPAELTCLASGKPQPVMVWYKREGESRRQILNDESHRVEVYDAVLVGPNIHDGDRWFTLRVLNVQHGDFGTYECEAKNIYGASFAEIKLFYTPTCQGRGCARRIRDQAEVLAAARLSNTGSPTVHSHHLHTYLLVRVIVTSLGYVLTVCIYK